MASPVSLGTEFGAIRVSRAGFWMKEPGVTDMDASSRNLCKSPE